MYGDIVFELLSSGSTATGTCSVQNFFGSYSGLSLLNQNDVVNIWVCSLGDEFYVGPSATPTNYNHRLKVSPALSQITLPAMRVGMASTLEFRRANGVGTNLALSANNASAAWTVWRKLPYAGSP
mgnify:FL=1